MDFYTNVKEIESKMGKKLAKNNLLYEFQTKRYPITLTIKQDRSPDAQMEIFDTTDGAVSSCDAVLRFIFKLDRLEVQTDSRLVIDDDLLGKIKGFAKKLHAAHTAAYYAERRNPEALRLYGDPDGFTTENTGKDAPEEPTEDVAEEDAAEDTEGDFSGFYDEADEPAEDEQ